MVGKAKGAIHDQNDIADGCDGGDGMDMVGIDHGDLPRRDLNAQIVARNGGAAFKEIQKLQILVPIAVSGTNTPFASVIVQNKGKATVRQDMPFVLAHVRSPFAISYDSFAR
jgi:hypothetical protein